MLNILTVRHPLRGNLVLQLHRGRTGGLDFDIMRATWTASPKPTAPSTMIGMLQRSVSDAVASANSLKASSPSETALAKPMAPPLT